MKIKARVIANHIHHGEPLGNTMEISVLRPTSKSYNGTAYNRVVLTDTTIWDFAFEDLEIVEVDGIELKPPLPMTHPIFNKFLTNTPKEV